jgi:hypothetical protein
MGLGSEEELKRGLEFGKRGGDGFCRLVKSEHAQHLTKLSLSPHPLIKIGNYMATLLYLGLRVSNIAVATRLSRLSVRAILK